MILALGLGGGCSTADGEATQRYETSGTVIDEGRQPMLCHGWGDSHPPSCRGVPIDGWNWDAVPHETAGQTRFGRYHVVITWDEQRSRYAVAGPVTVPAPQPDPWESRMRPDCPEPEGGWPVVPTTQEAVDEFLRKASEPEDYVGYWTIPIMAAPGPEWYVYNVAYLGDVEAHRARLDELWPGAVCVTQRSHTEAQLEAIRADFFSEVSGPTALGEELRVQSVGVLLWRGVVEVSLLVERPGLQSELDARYGPGVIELHPTLRAIASPQAVGSG
jgi:hypothetical protein